MPVNPNFSPVRKEPVHPLRQVAPLRVQRRAAARLDGDRTPEKSPGAAFVRRTAAAMASSSARPRTHARAVRRLQPYVLDEAIFMGALRRELKRAERLDQPVVVLRVALNDGVNLPASTVLPRVVEALAAASGDMAMFGWIEQGAALGAIVPEIPAHDVTAVSRLDALLRQELTARVDPETAAMLSVGVHVRSSATHGGDWVGPPLQTQLGSGDRSRTVREVIKRGLDVVGSLALLLVLAPLFAAIAALLKLSSPGPVLFRQIRIGHMARPFSMLKFRSMRVDADPALHQAFVTSFIRSGAEFTQAGRGAMFKLTKDPRVTPFGRILRKTSLDELPQLWNVLRGEMSLVGPRPPLAYEVEQYRRWHWRRVLDAKPGITGLWQVVGRSRTTFDEMVRLDLRYIRTHSLLTDLKILLATPRAVMTGKGAA